MAKKPGAELTGKQAPRPEHFAAAREEFVDMMRGGCSRRSRWRFRYPQTR